MSCVELALSAALDREWEAQSGRSEPLEPTVPVRTALELVLAATPGGIFAARFLGGATPDEVVAEVRDVLPAELSPWTRRSLHRISALRLPVPRLPAGEEVGALPPASEPIPIGPADIPQLPRPEPEPVVPPPATAGPEPEPVLQPTGTVGLEPAPVAQPPAVSHPQPVRTRSLAKRIGPSAVAASIGAGIAAASAGLDVGVGAAAGGGAAIAALVARFLGGRR